MEIKDKHFDRTFLYISISAGVVLLYVFLITFLPIPEKNQRFVDIALAFLLGWMSSNAAYLTGGNPNAVKKPPTGETTAEISATITKQDD